MTTAKRAIRHAAVILAVTSALTLARAEDRCAEASTRANTWAPPHHYIVQSASSPEAQRDVIGVGATVRTELPIIHGVIADLNDRQAAQLRQMPHAHVFLDRAAAIGRNESSLRE